MDMRANLFIMNLTVSYKGLESEVNHELYHTNKQFNQSLQGGRSG